MSRATPEIRNFAKRLMAHETGENRSSETAFPAAFHVGDRLRPQLATLMGNGGFRALLSRALALAKAEVPSLRAVQVNTDGALEGLEELHAQLDPNEFLEGKVALLAHLLGLMVAFIGQNLTLRLVREVWPEAPLDDLSSGNGGENEKTA